ncbi:hypothetical protein BGX27_010218 [Mortierella sp. AM989]|nr:hypothetical protein BGX27_010218 [Mortierella sp. AM989]
MSFNPFNIGSGDRLPAISGSSRKSSNGQNPLQQAVDPASNRGADMVLTPDHPSWHQDQQAQRPSSGAPSGSTPGSGVEPDADSTLPPGAVPQGARFDPIVPEGVRQGLPQRQQSQSGEGRNQQGSGEPDFDELLPPR